MRDTNTVAIQGVEAETFQQLLLFFLYTDTVPVINDPHKTLCTANKFECLGFKLAAEQTMISGLTMDTLLGIHVVCRRQ